MAARLLSLKVASNDDLDVRQFSIEERISSLFTVSLVAVSRNDNIEFDAVVGQKASLEIHHGKGVRTFRGIVNHLEHIAVSGSQDGLSTYQLSIVPELWLSTQRKNHRMFQQISEPDIVLQMLKEDWSIEPELKLSGQYKKRKYRVQYAESDYAFMRRMMEDAGISFYFEDKDGETKLVLSDAPHLNEMRAPIRFRDNPDESAGDFVMDVRMAQDVRPGKYTMRDHDYRLPPSYKLAKTASKQNVPVEEKLERFQYTPGAFLFESDKGEATPVADDRGKSRTDEREGEALAQKRLEAKRGAGKRMNFETNAHDIYPGMVVNFMDHPRKDLGKGKGWLVVGAQWGGTPSGRWMHACEAQSVETPYRTPLSTPRPKVNGVESATVVGPAGEEIHCDEFGRVRVHFHWDRESKMDEKSSCWIHVNQPWGGSGFGGMNLPRIGQEVLVDFLGGDPDRPVIVGRIFTNLQKVPYKLPENKTQSGWKSNSYPGGGGFNEMRFEDAKGKEQVYMQAEKDLKKLVKNNESVTIGNNRTKLVGANDSLTVGQNQKVSIGVNRATSVGMIDSTTVGETHVISIVPPGEGGGGENTTIMAKDGLLVLDTAMGATITLSKDKIIINAKTVEVTGGEKIKLDAPTVEVSGKEITVAATSKLKLSGKGSAELTSKGTNTVTGTPVQLNGPGLFAGRVTELAPATITTGAALVLVGGSSFPFPVVKQPDGSLKIGDHITLMPGEGRFENFQEKTLRDLGIMSSTPSGMERLNNIQNNPSGHDITIREYTADEAAEYGNNNSLAYGYGGSGLTYDADGNPVPGPGSDSIVSYNPDIVLGPNGQPEPADAILFHEMGHAEHNAYGVARGGEDMGDGWHNREEWQNIEGNVNQPGHSDIEIPGVPHSPSENDYLGDRDYPYIRTDHGSGYTYPDGSPINP